MAKDSSEKIDTTEKADDDGSEKVDTTEKAEEDGSEKVDITEKADDDGSEKVDTAEKADAADEETPDTGVQLGEPETQNDENNPAPSTSTESLVKSGSDPVAEPEKKEEDDGAQANFSSSSGSMKVDVQGDSPSTLKLSTSSDGEKKGSISGSEKRDEPKGDQASSSHSSSTKRVAFDEPADKMSEVNEEVQSENQGSQEISSKTLETRDSTTMTTIESEEPNYSEYSGFAEHLADFSVCSDSMFSKEESEDAKPQRGSSAEKFAQQAHELVNMVIENASKHLVKEQLRRQNTLDQLEVELSRGSTLVVSRPVYDNETIENIDWLTIEDFTVDRGTVKIEEFIKKTWFHQDNWLYCTDHLGKEEFDYDTRYRYRVRWSVPTRRKPIPRATACVYFTFSVSKVKPRDYPVDVYYVFETNRLVHRPGESRFREKWLKDIIESKVITMNGIHF